MKRHFDIRRQACPKPEETIHSVRRWMRLFRYSEACAKSQSIGAELLMRDRAAKRRLRILAGVLVILFILKGVTGNLQPPIAAQDVPAGVMLVDINEYAKLTPESGYYAWRGQVRLTGTVSPDAVHDTLAGYLDSDPVALFTVSRDLMTLEGKDLRFEALINVSRYTRGYHKIRIFSRQVNSLTEIAPLWTLSVYFESRPFASVANVNEFCNMRASASASSSLVTTVKLGEEVQVLSQEKGQFRSEYNTDIWYKVRYIASGGKIYDGYIISALVRILYIPDMILSAQDAMFEKFQHEKFNYEIHLPFSVSAFSISDIVRYNASDQIRITLNATAVLPPYTQLLLAPGDNRIEIIYQSGGANPGMVCKYVYQIRRIAESTETEFQKHLSDFPECYRQALLELHSRYPNWLFTAFDTELDWDRVIAAQDSGTTSLISIYTAPEYRKDDVIRDGTQFVVASRGAIEYYMDPRNFLDERRIFQFEVLNYQASIHTLSGVTRILSGSGLAGREALFLEAGIESNVSPYHLASRSRQEVTAWNPIGLSVIARGDYIVPETSSFTGPKDKYFGIYNFYNIGTGSSTDLDLLIRRGLEFALGNYSDGRPRPEDQRIRYRTPWDSEAKAITGGAIFIGSSYINRGQNTLYLQKFDVDPIDGLYVRQYMQNIQAPFHESSGAFNAYTALGVLGDSLLFRIPVYRNMPSMKAPKPEDTNKLDSLSVGEFSLSPAFHPSESGPYTVEVPSVTEKIKISATSSNSRAVIEGTGEKLIEFGDENEFIVSCIPQNESKREYFIRVIRTLPEKSTENRLENILIGNAQLTPAFSADYAGPYYAQVPDSVNKIPMDAVAKDPLAVIEGIGLCELDYGENEFYLTVTAEHGNQRTYTVRITRNLPAIDFGDLVPVERMLRGIAPLTSVQQLTASINAEPMILRVYGPSGAQLKSTDLVGTGAVVKFTHNDIPLYEYRLILLGDLNGDGRINSTDIAVLRSHILRIGTLNEAALSAADINGDGKVNSTDIARVRSHILRLSEINQKP